MPDNKLTYSKIVKALEEAIEYGCGHYREIEMPTIKKALDLINQQQERVDDLERNDLPRCKDALRRANEMGIELQAENERLKDCIDEQDIEIANLWKRIAEAKAEAYKEFAERLDKVSFITGYTTVFGGKDVPIKHITMANVHNVLKELVGEDNGKEKE